MWGLGDACHMLHTWQSFRLRLFFEGIIIGVLTGFVIGAFIVALNKASAARYYIFDNYIIPALSSGSFLPLTAWILFAIFLSYIIYHLCIHETMAMGGGIPQVKGALLGIMHMRWFRVLWVKFAGVTLGILGGLSIGRESPAVQMGAMIAQGISRFFKRIPMEEKYLLTSGSAAGLAAAFSAPLSGTMFAMEELNRNFSSAALLPSMGAAVSAVLVTKYIFGIGAIFVFPSMPATSISLMIPIIVASIICGFGGVLYNYGLTHIGNFYKKLHLTGVWPRLIFALMVAAAVAIYIPEIADGGDELVNHIVESRPELLFLIVLLIGKFLFTIISTGSGIPGGFLVPMFTIGALLGAVESTVFVNIGFVDPFYQDNIITIAMAAFVTASARAPLTAILLILELTGDFSHMTVLVLSSAIAFVVSGLLGGQPIYGELLNIALHGHAQKKEEKRSLIEIVVCTGSPLEGKCVKDLPLPPHAVLMDIKTSTFSKIPTPDTKILAGMHLYILTYISEADEVRRLGEPVIPASH